MLKIIKNVFHISCFLMLLAASPALVTTEAWSAPELRVAYVDIQKALELSKSGKKAQKGYEQEVKSAQKELDRKKDKFSKLRGDFEKQRGALKETSRLEREEELLQMERDLKRSFKDSQEKLRRRNTLLVADLVKELRRAVSDVGQKKGFTFIFEKGSQAVLYADSNIDITNEVVKVFDQRTTN